MSGYATQLISEAAIGGYDQQYLNGIKFELGTGQDTQTQMSNGVLLGSDNQTLLNALNDHQLEFYLRDAGYYTDPVMKKALGEGLPENHFINRFQRDIAKGFAGLENGLDRLYNLDTSKMSPLERTLFNYANLKAVTVPAYGGSEYNQVDRSQELMKNEINKAIYGDKK